MEDEVALRKKQPPNPELALVIMCLANLYEQQGSSESVALQEESLAIGKTLSAKKHIRLWPNYGDKTLRQRSKGYLTSSQAATITL